MIPAISAGKAVSERRAGARAQLGVFTVIKCDVPDKDISFMNASNLGSKVYFFYIFIIITELILFVPKVKSRF